MKNLSRTLTNNGLTDIDGNKLVMTLPVLPKFLFQFLWGLIYWLICQHKCAPMHSNRQFALDIVILKSCSRTRLCSREGHSRTKARDRIYIKMIIVRTKALGRGGKP